MLLNCHSYFSLRYGLIPEEELLSMGKAHGYRTVALTDINNTSGCLNFIRLASRYDIKPIIGVDFRNGVQQCYVGLAMNNQGFQNLNTFLSDFLHRRAEFPALAPQLESVVFIYPIAVVQNLQAFVPGPNEYVGISIKDVSKLQAGRLNAGRLRIAENRLVVMQCVNFRNKKDFNAHRLLRAVDENILLSTLAPSLTAEEGDLMLPETVLRYHFRNSEFVIRNTEKLMEQCEIHFSFGDQREHQNLRVFGSSREDDYQLIRKLIWEGVGYRYGDMVNDQIFDRISSELDLIEKQNFIPFFLVNHSITQYARHKNYHYVGRGSGANSIIAYLLQITNVDPIELDLYFERFMNLYRKNPPDFDIDFSWRDREDVTQYIFDNFGKNGRAALLATYSTFQHQAAIRELGKVFGLPGHEIDALSNGKYDSRNLDQLSTLVLKYADFLQQNNQPNHLSIHAGGILIAERPIQYFSATNLPPKGFPTTQFDMVIAEDVGLNKYDILGQRGLAKIKETLEVIAYNRPDEPVPDIDNVKTFMKDPNVNALIRQAQCIGCFYVESPAMRMLLKKLEVDNYLGLVAASSIIRPGVAKSGMMREYILRHRHPERREVTHPKLMELMAETYGIMVYQEDVIKVAHLFAQLTLGEADVIRRGMSGKFRGRDEFERVRIKYFTNCKKIGYDDKLAQDIWDQIASFAGYAFAKGHSASYAVESYQTLFLKAYYPLEFMVAVLNNGGGFYNPELYIHEARMLGAKISAPCINRSHSETIIIGNEIIIGLGFLNDLEEKTIGLVLHARQQGGAFLSLNDFLERVPVSIEQLSILIRIDAFRFTHIDKRNLLWKAHFWMNRTKTIHQEKLFHTGPKDFNLPSFEYTPVEEAYDQIELLGFPLCSPFELVKNGVPRGVMSSELHHFINQDITQYGYLVATKTTRTAKGENMYFGTFLDQEGHFIDTVHFPPVAKQYRFSGNGVYRLRGKAVEEFGFLSLEVTEMTRLDLTERG